MKVNDAQLSVALFAEFKPSGYSHLIGECPRFLDKARWRPRLF